MTETKGIRQAAFETRQLIEAMSKIAVGETFTFKEVMAACHLPSIEGCRGYLNTARNSLRREGKMFESVRGVGLRRMSDEEIALNCPAWRRKRIRTQARGIVKDTTAIENFEGLSNEGQISVYVAQTEAAIIQKATSRKMNNRLSDAARAKNEELAVGESLRLLMQN